MIKTSSGRPNRQDLLSRRTVECGAAAPLSDDPSVIFVHESEFLNRTVFVPWSVLGLAVLTAGVALWGVARLGRINGPFIWDCALLLVGAGACCVTVGAISYGRLMWRAAGEARRQASVIVSGPGSIAFRRHG